MCVMCTAFIHFFVRHLLYLILASLFLLLIVMDCLCVDSTQGFESFESVHLKDLFTLTHCNYSLRH